MTFIIALAVTLTAGAERLPLTGGVTDATVGLTSTQEIKIQCDAMWGGINLIGGNKISTSDYKKAVIELADLDGVGSENFSLLCKYEGNGTAYAFQGNVAGTGKKLENGVIEFDLTTGWNVSAGTYDVDLTDKTFTELTIKNRDASYKLATIKSFYLIDNNENRVATTYTILGSTTLLSPTTITAGQVKFGWNWAKLGGDTWACGATTAGDDVIYAIFLDAPYANDNLQMLRTNGSSETGYQNLNTAYKGMKTIYYRFTADASTNITACRIQRNDGGGTAGATVLNVNGVEVNINKVAFEIPESGITTFCYNKALDLTSLPAGVKAYTVSSVADGKANVTEITATAVQAWYPFIIAGTPGIHTIAYSTETGSWPNTKMKGNGSINTFYNVDADENTYVLSGGQFHSLKNSGAKIPPLKGYLKVDAPAGARLNIVFNGDETTGIETVKSAKADNQYYNMSGQRVAQPTKGLYIVNGKKVIKK